MRDIKEDFLRRQNKHSVEIIQNDIDTKSLASEVDSCDLSSSNERPKKSAKPKPDTLPQPPRNENLSKMKTFFSNVDNQSTVTPGYFALGTRQFDKLDANDPWHQALKKLHPENRKPFRVAIEKIKERRKEFESL